MSIDFSASSGYFTESMKAVHTLFQLETMMHNVLLKVNEVEMYDSVVNPFNSATDEKEFLSIEQWEQRKTPDNFGIISIDFTIDGSLNHSQRTRYNFWMALGDIGGFHDGMNLLIGIFMGPISAALFFQSFVDGGVYQA